MKLLERLTPKSAVIASTWRVQCDGCQRIYQVVGWEAQLRRQKSCRHCYSGLTCRRGHLRATHTLRDSDGHSRCVLCKGIWQRERRAARAA